MEVCVNGTYYPVCDEGWDDSDAAVVCNYLGYNYQYYRECKLESLKKNIIISSYTDRC